MENEKVIKLLSDILNHENNLSANDIDSINEIITAFKPKQIVDEYEPVLVGYLNRKYGANGYKDSEIGTPVYEIPSGYFYLRIPLNDGTPVRVMYYKDTFKSEINFIENN
jgi:hypothetical protein